MRSERLAGVVVRTRGHATEFDADWEVEMEQVLVRDALGRWLPGETHPTRDAVAARLDELGRAGGLTGGRGREPGRRPPERVF